jgi:hypothetical protein
VLRNPYTPCAGAALAPAGLLGLAAVEALFSAETAPAVAALLRRLLERR